MSRSERTRIDREAKRTWRRAGVRRFDQRRLLAELNAELDGAQADGRALSTVLGHDHQGMLRAWAHERGVDARALRLWLVVPAGIIGIVAGTSVILVAL